MLGIMINPSSVGVGVSGLRPNNSFKPNPLCGSA